MLGNKLTYPFTSNVDKEETKNLDVSIQTQLNLLSSTEFNRRFAADTYRTSGPVPSSGDRRLGYNVGANMRRLKETTRSVNVGLP